MNAFEKFCVDILRDFYKLVSSAAGKYKLLATKGEHMWCTFHLKRMKGHWTSVWKNMKGCTHVSYKASVK